MRYISLIAVFFIITSFATVYAEEYAGDIVNFKGSVKIYKKDDLRGTDVDDNNTCIFVGDSVKTRRAAEAFVKMTDGSKVILEEMSSLIINGIRNTEVGEGKVLFDVTKSGQISGFMVKTKTATIGVKGTQFAVVSDNNSLDVFLNEGEVSVEAIKGKFKRYVKKELDEFEAFILQQKGEYDEYKESLQKEFVEYVRSFTIKEGSAVSISDNEVRDIEIPEDIKNKFELFDKF
jgi:hypothetical protein